MKNQLTSNFGWHVLRLGRQARLFRIGYLILAQTKQTGQKGGRILVFAPFSKTISI
jgi:hypothetical protein